MMEQYPTRPIATLKALARAGSSVDQLINLVVDNSKRSEATRIERQQEHRVRQRCRRLGYKLRARIDEANKGYTWVWIEGVR